MCFHKSPYFSYKKSRQKNFPPITPLYFSKVFEVPRDFSRKVPCVRVWGGQPQLITHTKSTAPPCFYLVIICWNWRSKPPSLTFLIRKVSKRISHRTTPLYFCEAFEVTRDFFFKKSLGRCLGLTPQHSTLTQKKHGGAVLFYRLNISELKKPIYFIRGAHGRLQTPRRSPWKTVREAFRR